MRTGAGVLHRLRNDVEDDLAAALALLARGEPQELTETPAMRDRYLKFLMAEEFWAGPAFVIPSVLPAENGAVEIGPDNADLLRGGLEAWLPDVGRRGRFLAIIEHGRAVSICASVRITRFVHCAGVETVPDRRGQGHAARVVAAWAAAVRGLGAVPFYSTSWDNLASRAVARRLRLELVAVDFHVG